jgi:hypothetical protein
MVAFACLLLEDECLFLQIAKLRDWVRSVWCRDVECGGSGSLRLACESEAWKNGGLGLWFRPEQQQHHKLDADCDCHFTESFLCTGKHDYRGRGKR